MAYFCGRLHSRFGDKRDGENENEKKRVWQVAFAPEVTALQRESDRESYSTRMGFWGTTFAFCVLEGACAVYINATGIRGAKHVKHLLSVTAVACMWMMWAIIYMAQMYPLVQPVRNKGE